MKILEIIRYLTKDKNDFHVQAQQSEQMAETSYQKSIKSAVDVARSARRVRSNADFLREVMKGNGS